MPGCAVIAGAVGELYADARSAASLAVPGNGRPTGGIPGVDCWQRRWRAGSGIIRRSRGARPLPGPRGRARLPGRGGGDAGSRLGDRGHRGRVPGGAWETSAARSRRARRSVAIVAEARAAVADLVGGPPEGVVFGPSATALAYRIADALSRAWTAGDDVVVSRLDHDSNVRPWIQAAGRAGVTVKWAEVDLVTGELPAAQYADLVGPRTRLVAVTAASNAIGTRPDVAAIAAVRARRGRAVLRGRRACHPARAGGRGRARRRLLLDERVQVVRPAPGRARRRPGAPRDGMAGQARAVVERGAVAVRARHAAVRRPGRA